MGKNVEAVSLEGTKIAYLKVLTFLNIARTHYETSGKKSEKLHEEINYYEKEVKKYEEKLRGHDILPESIFGKRNDNPKTAEIAHQYADDKFVQTP